jgi:FtsP/CotA-like multicopper oxidase with cupredoxin domain
VVIEMRKNNRALVGRCVIDENVQTGSVHTTKDVHKTRSYTLVLSLLAAAVVMSFGAQNTASAAVNVPTDLSPSPLFGANSFSQQMLRFEEFGLQPLPAPGTATPKTMPPTVGCDGRPDGAAMDAFLDLPLWPAPTRLSNVGSPNPWATAISGCISSTIMGVLEGRAPGESWSHQRWDEFPPQRYFQTAQGGARANGGIRDDEQSHGYSVGVLGPSEFGPPVAGELNETGLYNNVTGVGGTGTTSGLDVRFHPSMPVQDKNSLWTFGDGTLPPKLLRVRYAEAVLFRHYNALPIDVSANNGFGEHTITTHEHNGHTPAESDGFAAAFFFPGQFYDYRWPLQLAGYDSINTNASDPRASTPCKPGEVMMITVPASGNPGGGTPLAKTCDPDTLTINISGDYHEIMSTHWFHDHMIDRTAQNVYKGNAAMMNYYSGIDRGNESFRCNYADPANNVNLCFPSGTALNWGNRDYDVQLLIADKAWDSSGQLAFAPLNADGFLGDRMTVNWLYNPYFDVRARKYRFRVLDGSVSRFFKIAIVREFNDSTSGTFPGLPGSNKSYSRIPFHMIANDGNIMEHAIPFPNSQSDDLPIQGIAERYDIIIDFSQFPVGTKLHMVNTLSFDNGRGPKDIIPLADILDGTFAPTIKDGEWDEDPTVGKFLEFRVQAYSGTDLSMNPADYEIGKKMMIPKVRFTDAELAGALHRTFEFGRGGGGGGNDNDPTPWTIKTDNGDSLTADMNRVSAAPETMDGGVEIWHLVNGGGGWAHPIHIHFEEGQILLRGDEVFGQKFYHLPPLWEAGARKDLYRVSDMGLKTGIADSSMIVDVAIRFREFAGTYMEHCHNTQHEDKAMLLRWDNENPGQTIRIPTPIPDWHGVTYATPTELATIKTGDTVAAATFVAPNQIRGDLDWDGLIGFSDFGLFRTQFGQAGPWGADLNDNNLVGFDDFGLFRANFGLSAGFPLPLDNPLP